MMEKLISSCGIYLDWDNIWGGILDFISIKVNHKNPIILTQSQKKIMEDFIYVFSRKLHETQPDVRYIKAFADFDSLPYANNFYPSITNILHNSEIEPFPSFVRAGKTKFKNTSDTSLILEVIEDIFFTKKLIDHVIIASGDIDFYPLFTFIREHSDKKVYISSFKKSLNSYYKKISYLNKEAGIIFIDDLMSSYSFSSLPLSEETEVAKMAEKEPELSTVPDMYDTFKSKLLKGIQNWMKSKSKEVKTGLVIGSWLPRWELSITVETANDYLKRMKDEGVIDIISTNPQNPLQGTVKII